MRGIFIIATKENVKPFFQYFVIWDVDEQCYKLLNVNTNNIMSGFKAYCEKDIRDYIEKRLKLKIIGWMGDYNGYRNK